MDFVADPGMTARDKIIANLLNLFGWVIVLISLGEVAIHYAIFPAPLSFYNLAACIILTVFGSALVALSAVWPIGKPQWQAVVRKIAWPLIVRRRRVMVFTVLALWGITEYQVTSLRSDFDTYVVPRHVTTQQAESLKSFLSGDTDKFDIEVKTNVQDKEALEYGAQLFNALNQSSSVTAKFNPTNPFPSNDGVCLQEEGTSAKPKIDQKHDPAYIVGQAFLVANLELNCSGGSGAGDYKLLLIVGHRPVAVGLKPPALFRLGQWLMSLAR